MTPGPDVGAVVGDRDALAGAQAIVASDRRRVFVLDDDSTGSQTASDVDVYLTPDGPTVDQVIAGSARSLYLVTNTRALDEASAVAHVGDIAEKVRHQPIALVLRGDSTLRGHVFAEIDAVARPRAVSIFVPAFPEGGRHTIGGIHYLDMAGLRTPAAHTEFARDPLFGYRSIRIDDWAREVGDDRPLVLLDLDDVRSGGPEVIADRLLAAGDGALFLPDAETVADVAVIAAGVVLAERRGRPVVARSAATYAALRAGVWSGGEHVSAPHGLDNPRALIVCGSHTSAATEQLAALEEVAGEVTILDMPTALNPADASLAQIADRISALLDEDRIAVLASARTRQVSPDSRGDGASMMSALTSVVRRVASHVDVVIAKGGITSVDVAVHGLGASKAHVAGQLFPGISLWSLRRSGGGESLPYVVVPGNVGSARTLVEIVHLFRPGLRGGPAHR